MLDISKTVWAADDPNLVLARNTIKDVRKACTLSDLDDLMPELSRIERSASGPVTIDDFRRDVTHLLRRIFDELGNESYLHLDRRDVEFYENKRAFGDAVIDKFPMATEDIEAAGNCISLQQPTACVFHLMRVLEVGVQALARKLKIKLDPKEETWRQVLLHLNKAIKAAPCKTASQRAKRARYSAAAAQLGGVRMAWRNDVMQPKQTYTREQAREVFDATRLFMTHLASLV